MGELLCHLSLLLSPKSFSLRLKIHGLSLDESPLPKFQMRQWILLWAVVTRKGLSPPGVEETVFHSLPIVNRASLIVEMFLW